jgi:hypothetical protein
MLEDLPLFKIPVKDFSLSLVDELLTTYIVEFGFPEDLILYIPDTHAKNMMTTYYTSAMPLHIHTIDTSKLPIKPEYVLIKPKN